MRKSYLLIAALTLGIFACKKDTLSTKDQYSKLISGTWKTSQQNVKVYNLNTNELLKDSTIIFDQENTQGSWSEIYNTDGNAYVTVQTRKLGAAIATTDTTTYSSYSIVGASLILKQHIGGSQTKPILAMNETEMGLQYSFTGNPGPAWGLEGQTTYKIVQATYYTKQ